MGQKNDNEDKKVKKWLIILVLLYVLAISLKCIVGSWWNIILLILILCTAIWCYKRKKKHQTHKRGTFLILLFALLLAWKVIPCAWHTHLTIVEETPEDQKQRELEEEAALKKFEEEQKRAQEERDRLAAEQEAEEKNKPQPKPEPKPARPVYNFKEDKDCSDFSSSTEATAFMKASKAAGFGDHRLDYNHDGIACN
ncbi:excalibur calcium-binding domain-containing protein [Fictibacillus nanhaiensis]|uniref:excalibur calcium-binding domain-containing protein n=1 Tax=Fictibacillus nanhaiensis TaxID=742169 RepID=UPI00203A7E14|nr:excalibur calcium-binding domain-containing protein [Fictibacillus nanhaiensis]MCM3732710.1 excalibur calcium-binding domain-containing protein [Fictibacillus nanhaiensis]